MAQMRGTRLSDIFGASPMAAKKRHLDVESEISANPHQNFLERRKIKTTFCCGFTISGNPQQKIAPEFLCRRIEGVSDKYDGLVFVL